MTAKVQREELLRALESLTGGLSPREIVEQWKDIPGYDGAYQASKRGSIRSVPRVCPRDYHGDVRKPGKEFCPKPTKAGYIRLPLCKNGRCRPWLVHRLVWITFRGPIPDHLEINHKNTKKSDNRLSNLELVTRLKNMHHAKANGLLRPARGERQGSCVLTEEQVREIRRLYVPRKMLLRRLARMFKVDMTNIYYIVKGKTWRHL